MGRPLCVMNVWHTHAKRCGLLVSFTIGVVYAQMVVLHRTPVAGLAPDEARQLSHNLAGSNQGFGCGQ